jgi:hypothetical protein
MSEQPEVRRPKVDAADAVDTSETFLPGQIPVKDADSAAANLARATEQQPDPAEAAQAVNPEFLSGMDRETGGAANPEAAPAEDQKTGE